MKKHKHPFLKFGADLASLQLTSLFGAVTLEHVPGYISKFNTLFLNDRGHGSQFWYDWSLPHAKLMMVCPRERFAANMARRPSSLSTVVRSGNAELYLAYLKAKSPNLLPVLSTLQINTREDIASVIKAATFLFTESLPAFVFCPQSLLASVKGGLGGTVRWEATFVDSIATGPLTALNQLPSKVERKSDIPAKVAALLTFDSWVMLCVAPGFNYKAYTLPAPAPKNTALWTEAFQELGQLLQLTLQEGFLSLHSRQLKEHLAETQHLVPGLDFVPTPPDLSYKPLALTQKCRVTAHGLTSAFLSYDEAYTRHFNPAEGRLTGLKSALLSKPNILAQDTEQLGQFLKAVGYELSPLSPELKRFFSKRRRFFARQMLPLSPVKGTELLAYYTPGYYTCIADVFDPVKSKLIWRKGTNYYITPSWQRQQVRVPDTEPIVDSEGNVVGAEEFSVKFSVLELIVETEFGTASILENECRNPEKDDEEDKLETEEVTADEGEEDSKPAAKSEEWKPMLDEFLLAFELPKVPTAKEVLATDYKRYLDILQKELPFLKAYQSNIAVLNALKSGGILGSEMGGGKTYQALAIVRLKQKAFNLIVVPPSMVSHWIRACRTCGLWARRLLDLTAVAELKKHYAYLKQFPEPLRRTKMFAPQEVYVTTPEFLALGGDGNKVYDEWTATYEVPEAWKNAHGVTARDEQHFHIPATRYHAQNEAHELHISLNRSHLYGAHIKKCPSCGATHREGFTKNGFCNNQVVDAQGRTGICGYRAYAYRSGKRRVYRAEVEINLRDWVFDNGQALPTTSGWEFERHVAHVDTTSPQPIRVQIRQCVRTKEKASAKDKDAISLEVKKSSSVTLSKTQQKCSSDANFPAYKLLGKIFGLKVIDEVHLLASLEAQKSAAVFAIKCDQTYCLSGTLSRGYVTDYETALAFVQEANSPAFPFSAWEPKAFRDQFITMKVKRAALYGGGAGAKTSQTLAPEASNVNRLRRMLSSVTTMVDPKIIEEEWQLPPLRRIYHAVTLSKTSQQYYHKVLADLVEWYKYASSRDIQRNAMSRLWELRHICDNDEKMAVIANYVKEWIKEGRKFVLVAPQRPLYVRMRQLLRDYGIQHLAIDESVAPEDREFVLQRFASPDVHAVVSRTKLVATGINNLVFADRILNTSLDYHHATLRQLEKRLVRPGQLSKEVVIVYPLVRMTPRLSVEEEMLRLILKKESAVNEVLKGKNRWMKPAMLIESALASQGAIQVLKAVAGEVPDDWMGAADLDALFATAPVSTPQRLRAHRNPITSSVLASDGLSEVSVEDLEI